MRSSISRSLVMPLVAAVIAIQGVSAHQFQMSAQKTYAVSDLVVLVDLGPVVGTRVDDAVGCVTETEVTVLDWYKGTSEREIRVATLGGVCTYDTDEGPRTLDVSVIHAPGLPRKGVHRVILFLNRLSPGSFGVVSNHGVLGVGEKNGVEVTRIYDGTKDEETGVTRGWQYMPIGLVKRFLREGDSQ